MEVQTAISLSPLELEAIIRQFLSSQGYVADAINFELDTEGGNVSVGDCHIMCRPKAEE